jgi:hypothetical protein
LKEADSDTLVALLVRKLVWSTEATQPVQGPTRGNIHTSTVLYRRRHVHAYNHYNNLDPRWDTYKTYYRMQMYISLQVFI